MKLPPPDAKAIIRSERGSMILDGQRYRFTKVGEKSCLYKLIEKKETKENNGEDTRSTKSTV